MSKRLGPYSKLLYIFGQDFLDIQYMFRIFFSLNIFFALMTFPLTFYNGVFVRGAAVSMDHFVRSLVSLIVRQ